MSVIYDITVKNLEQANKRPIHAGDDYSHGFVATQDGLPVDLTGGKLWFTIKEDSSLPDPDAKLQYDSETPGGDPNIEITNAAAGAFTLHLRDTDTAGLEGLWPYDIKARLGGIDAEIIRLARGKIEFLPNLTRSIT